MKYFFTFIAGVAVGAGGMMLWLRKDIKKQLDEIKTDSVAPDIQEEKEPEKPDSEEKRKEYHKAVMEVIDAVPTPYREMSIAAMEKNEEQNEDEEPPVEKKRTIDIHGIDADTFIHDHDYMQEHIVYYRGDKIMATENGTRIEKPAILVGNLWEDEIGRYANRTAFIRNHSLMTDYEIYVEDGSYVDEYGPIDDRED